MRSYELCIQLCAEGGSAAKEKPCPIHQKLEQQCVPHHLVRFKTKLDSDGEIDRFKARLVACGNEQIFSVDNGLTFAAVMEMSTVKFILVLATLRITSKTW